MARDRGQIYEASEAFKDALQIRLEFQFLPITLLWTGGKGSSVVDPKWFFSDQYPYPTFQSVSDLDPEPVPV